MALYINGKKIINFSINSKIVTSMWRVVNGKIVKIYESVRSCFGSGDWRSNLPWVNNDVWKN